MNKNNQELEYRNNNILGIIVGLLVGALAGAVTMLLMAPQSGKDTRSQIQEKSIELRDRTTGMVGDAMTQMREDRKQMTSHRTSESQRIVGAGPGHGG